MIEANITGTQDAVARIQRMSPAIRVQIAKRLEPLLIRMQSWVKTERLEGGHPLHRRTGTLSRSIHYDQKQDERGIVGRLYAGPEAPYARVHELGGTFNFNVPAHIRTIRQAFGRPIDPVQVQVRPFSYSATYPARPFLRPALPAHREQFARLVREAIAEAAKA